MVRSTALPLLILAAISQTPPGVGAASITYSMVDYPTLQNGYTVSGTITTNGATGMNLPASDLTSWDITISLGSNTVATITQANSINLTVLFNATPTAITVPTAQGIGINLTIPGGDGIRWEHINLRAIYTGTSPTVPLWSSFLPTTDSPIATIPEPSSAVLASIGAVAAFLAYGWFRHRRAQRRQAAASWRPL
jgi:hypothetical protein